MLQYESIINSLKRGVIAPVYLLYGEEDYLQEKIVNAFKETLLTAEMAAFNLDEVEGEKCTPAQVADLANTLPVFAEKRLVIVKDFPPLWTRKKDEDSDGDEDKEKDKDDDADTPEATPKGEQHDENAVLLKYLANVSPSTCLIFWQKGKVKKTTKLYKAIAKAGEVLEIGSLKGTELGDWLVLEAKKMGKRLDRPALEYILINCGNQLRHLHNELEKLSLYCGNETTITIEAVKEVVTKTVEGNVFNLVDGLGLGKGDAALSELRNLLILGEPYPRLIYMIARQFRLLLLVKEAAGKGLTEKKIATDLKLHPYVTGKILRQARNFSYVQLEKSLNLILEADVGMKSGLKPVLTLERLIVALTAARQK
ncbi:MAG: DNA polymerase III subunit delta [Peptococcia bacterium]|jgi:DNA polymerase-3 subunit delta